MQVIKQIVKVPPDRELRIRLPADVKAHEEVEVIVLFNAAPANPEQKLAAMREAAADPLFLADLNGTAEDFKHTEHDEYAVSILTGA